MQKGPLTPMPCFYFKRDLFGVEGGGGDSRNPGGVGTDGVERGEGWGTGNPGWWGKGGGGIYCAVGHDCLRRMIAIHTGRTDIVQPSRLRDRKTF